VHFALCIVHDLIPMPFRLLAVLAHPDDESLGFGGTLAKYAAEGVETFLVTATRGEKGRYRGQPPGHASHPGSAALAAIREDELRRAVKVLGIRDLTLLGYPDQGLDAVDHQEAVGRIAREIRRLQPHVVITFAPDGSYGHPDHIAISQLTAAATIAAATGARPAAAGEVDTMPPHAVSKLYYIAWPASTWAAYQDAFRKMVSIVDGVERQAVPWPDWELTTAIDTRESWTVVWDAVSCHESQIAGYERLKHLSPEHHEGLWGSQSFYRVFSTVNGGRRRESDLFEGLR
jgi:LmbE family N-acetylglucosaminyl deacetylase